MDDQRFEPAPSHLVRLYRPEIDRLLAALGYPEAWVTDESRISDLPVGPEEDEVSLAELGAVLGVTVEEHDLLVEVAQRLRTQQQDAEWRARLEMLRQSNATLAEAAQLLKATRLDIEAQLRQRRQEPLWSIDCRGSAGVDLIRTLPTSGPTASGGPFMSDRFFDATPDYESDFYGWTQAQAATIRAGAWGEVDREHVAEEIADLWKSDTHYLAMLLLGFLELIYRRCPAEEGQYYWQSAVIDFHRSMLERCCKDRQRVWPVLEACLPEEYAWAREQILRRRMPPRQEPPERCPWPLDQLLDERWWPPEAPPRLP